MRATIGHRIGSPRLVSSLPSNNRPGCKPSLSVALPDRWCCLYADAVAHSFFEIAFFSLLFQGDLMVSRFYGTPEYGNGTSMNWFFRAVSVHDNLSNTIVDALDKTFVELAGIY